MRAPSRRPQWRRKCSQRPKENPAAVSSIESVAIALRARNEESVLEIGRELASWLLEHEIKVVARSNVVKVLGIEGIQTVKTLTADLVVVFGGDGTLLSTAREVAHTGALLVGVNMGRLGFLAEVSKRRMIPVLTSVIEGKYSIEERTMLEVSVLRKGKEIETFAALNDAVVDKGSIARLLRFDVRIDRAHLTEYAADGLIVATPTGSTGYSMAAGGPLLHPSVQAFLLTPICPHQLSGRPIAIPDTSEIAIKLKDPSEEATLTIDGQVAYPMAKSDIVRIRKSEYGARLVRIPGRSYYEVLRSKFHWNKTTD